MGGGWRNKLAYLGLTDLQMPIIHTWNVSLNMWNYHTNYRYGPSPACPCKPCCAVACFLGSKRVQEQQNPADSYLTVFCADPPGWSELPHCLACVGGPLR